MVSLMIGLVSQFPYQEIMPLLAPGKMMIMEMVPVLLISILMMVFLLKKNR